MANASREEVLAWMAATSSGYKQAARHFGLSPDTVKSWRRRANEPHVSHLSTPAPQNPPHPPPAPPRTPDAPPVLPPAPTEPFTAAEREEKLLRAVDVRLNVLADPRSVGMRGESTAAVTLGILIDKLKILRGAGGPIETGSAQKADAVAAAMGLEE